MQHKYNLCNIRFIHHIVFLKSEKFRILKHNWPEDFAGDCGLVLKLLTCV